MENICRICMSKSATLVDIFSKEPVPDNKQSVEDILRECVNSCELRQDDKLPQKICTLCISDAQTAFRLKRRCKKSYAILSLKVEQQEVADLISTLESEDWEFLPTVTEVKTEIVDNVDESSQAPESKSFKDQKQATDFKEKDLDKSQNSAEARPYNFRYCSKGKLKNLAIIDQNDRPHKCTYCIKTFKRIQVLKVHEKSHTGERNFKCPDCPKAFITAAQLKVHGRVHTGERPHQCPHCDKGFSSKQNLKAHISRHTADRPQSSKIYFRPLPFKKGPKKFSKIDKP